MSGAWPAFADGPDWEVRPEPRRVVSIGDLHGDLRGFGAIGRACGLLDERGGWRGGLTHLVLMGDLVGGEHSRLLLNAVMRLEREALRAGGRVHALLGNHDLLPIAGRFLAYALGSALENHDEEGVSSDPRFGENNTLYLQATATLPTLQNDVELENLVLDALRERAIAAGFEFLSTLIEERVRETGPEWLRRSTILERIDDYLRSAMTFVYLQAALR